MSTSKILTDKIDREKTFFFCKFSSEKIAGSFWPPTHQISFSTSAVEHLLLVKNFKLRNPYINLSNYLIPRKLHSRWRHFSQVSDMNMTPLCWNQSSLRIIDWNRILGKKRPHKCKFSRICPFVMNLLKVLPVPDTEFR